MKKMYFVLLFRLRVIGILEGISYLVLLCIAMPLKYLAAIPLAVKTSGWVHGALFVSFLFALAEVWYTEKWTFKKGLWALLASILPFGTFILDKQLRKEEELKLSPAAKS